MMTTALTLVRIVSTFPHVLFLHSVGEKRKLKIPSHMGYGDSGSPPKIPGRMPRGRQ